MNKKIKLAIAGLLSIGIFSVICPGQLSIINTKAYAASSTYSLADRGELKSLEVKSTTGESLELCDDYGGRKDNLTDYSTYYITLYSKSDGVKVFAECAGEGYVTKIFGSNRGNATAYDSGEEISLEKGISTIYIRTFTSQEAFERAEDNEEVDECDKTYKININKVGTDEIYLEKLTLDSGKIPINFDRDIRLYNISVDEDTDEVAIKAIPEDEDDTVKIDGFKANEDNNYKKDLHLQMGKNEININVTNDYDKFRTYTLNLTRGGTTETNNLNVDTSDVIPNTSNDEGAITVKADQWVQVNGKWQYNDSIGNPIKNSWFKNYFLQADGNMATGWLSNNGKWYYLGSDGAMKTGWQLVNGKWYYLDLQGVMAYNTKIGKYKLGTDGAWIK